MLLLYKTSIDSTYHRDEVAAVLQSELDEALSVEQVDLVTARLRQQLLLLPAYKHQDRTTSFEIIVASGRAGIHASKQQ